MLVLNRKLGETILVGVNGEVEIMVVMVKGDKVRIGITAPKDVPIYRAEVADNVKTNGPRTIPEIFDQTPAVEQNTCRG